MSQTSTKTDAIFQSTLKYKTIMSLIGGSVVTALTLHSMKGIGVAELLGMFIGIWAGLYYGFVSHKVTLSDTALSLKTGVFSSKRFQYAEAAFRLEEKTGFESWASSLTPKSYTLFAKQGDKKETSIADTYGQSEFIRMIKMLEEKTGKTIDKPESLQQLL